MLLHHIKLGDGFIQEHLSQFLIIYYPFWKHKGMQDGIHCLRVLKGTLRVSKAPKWF